MLFVINLLLGIGLLVSGRKLFWLFVAAAGFFAGAQLAARFWSGADWLAIVVGLIAGVLFALLAMALKSVAIALAGFLLGGSALVSLASILGFDKGPLVWLIYLAGGVLGIILLSTVFDWALIGISSFAGASITTQTLGINRPLAGLVILVLLLVGIFIQAGQRRREKNNDD